MGINKLHSVIYRLYLGGGIFRLLGKALNRYKKMKYHTDIPYSLNLDGVYLCHNGFGIVINPESIIGKGTVIQHCVTIGEMDGTHKCPVIGEGCFIGARAIILGNITVGNNVKIGAGAVVIRDVPDNCTVVGIPARIVETKY